MKRQEIEKLPFIIDRESKTISLTFGRKFVKEENILLKKIEILIGMREIVNKVWFKK